VAALVAALTGYLWLANLYMPLGEGPAGLAPARMNSGGEIVQSVMGYASRHRVLVIVAVLIFVFIVLPVVALQLATVAH